MEKPVGIENCDVIALEKEVMTVIETYRVSRTFQQMSNEEKANFLREQLPYWEARTQDVENLVYMTILYLEAYPDTYKTCPTLTSRVRSGKPQPERRGVMLRVVRGKHGNYSLDMGYFPK